jgi:hypothetical protein
MSPPSYAHTILRKGDRSRLGYLLTRNILPHDQSSSNNSKVHTGDMLDMERAKTPMVSHQEVPAEVVAEEAG